MLSLPFGPRDFGDLVALSVVFLAQAWCAWILWRNANLPRLLRRAIPVLLALSCGFVVFGFVMGYHRFNRFLPAWYAGWGRGIATTWAFFSVLLSGFWGFSRIVTRVRSDHSPARRSFLRATQAALLGVPAVATGYGVFINRFRISLREQNIVIPGLPADLDGIRLAQLTDIHLSAFLSERDLARAVDLANSTRPHIMLVTGDLITAGGDPLDACLAQLARLRADAGIFGCNGNHEVYTRTERYVQQVGARQGMKILRKQNEQLHFGSATLNLAGVDYQQMHKPYLRGAEKLIQPGVVNILLSHNPDVFPVAAAQGYDLTIAGHTHGGQVRVEILHQDLNVARFFTPYVDGLYRRTEGGAERSIFVSRGIGTIALPARLGAPPEVAVLKLCRS